MKKLLLTLCVALFAMSAQAQQKGDFAVGLRGGPTIYKVLGETTTQFGFGVFGQYSLSKHFRLDLEAIYKPKQDDMSEFQVGLDVQYLFHVTDAFKIYPMLGYSVAFIHEHPYTHTNGTSTTTSSGGNSTDGGIQLGAGLQYNLGENWFVGVEYRYQPAIVGGAHVPVAKVGYRF